MPNWCTNRVRVYANNIDELQEFKNFVSIEFNGTDKETGEPWSRVQDFSFEAIKPMPEELHKVQSPVTIMTEEEIEEYKNKHSKSSFMSDTLPITQKHSDELNAKYGCNNWYDWANNNWGVKWDCGDVDMEVYEDDLYIVYIFDTPWGPPENIYDVLTEKFPNIGLQWFWDEPGMEMAGYLGNN